MGITLHIPTIRNLKLNPQTQKKYATGKAPGKIILFGEHSVVYGQPAIAIPLNNLNVITEIKESNHQTTISSDKIGLNTSFKSLPQENPIGKIILLFSRQFSINITNINIQIHSKIPVASGLGSGAAVSTSLLKALSEYYQIETSNDQINKLVFEIEKIHHGNPSGIDNTTIVYATPIFYQKKQPIEILKIKNNYHFIIAHSGIQAPTKQIVSKVKQRYTNNPDLYSKYFNDMGEICLNAKQAFNTGNIKTIGELMNKNQHYLEKINVSSPALSKMINSSKKNGAIGAKLSGAGIGGNIIALVPENNLNQVKTALKNAGATQVFSTTLKENK